LQAQEDIHHNRREVCKIAVRALLALFLAGAALIVAAQTAAAHAMEVEQGWSEAVEITAAYDTGDPVDGGQVLVYAPGDDSEPWATGTTDHQGRYAFVPDASQTGEWEIQVRQAGHAASTSVEVGDSREKPGAGDDREEFRDESRPEDSGEARAVGSGDTVQRVLMGAAVVWGFIGTALFFASRRN
jgi:nickel transport protein